MKVVYPCAVRKELKRFIKILIENLEPEDPNFKDYDLDDVEYFKKYYYEDSPSPFAK